MTKLFATLAVLAVFTFSESSVNSSAAEYIPNEKEEGINVVKGKESPVVIHLTKEEFFEKVFNYETNTDKWKYEGDKPCIVDFYADWCQPCKIAGPILEKLAEEYDGKIYIYKVDTEKERELAGAFGIQSIPTFLLCPMEGMPQVFSGIGQTEEATREMFVEAIEKVLLTSESSSE